MARSKQNAKKRLHQHDRGVIVIWRLIKLRNVSLDNKHETYTKELFIVEIVLEKHVQMT